MDLVQRRTDSSLNLKPMNRQRADTASDFNTLLNQAKQPAAPESSPTPNPGTNAESTAQQTQRAQRMHAQEKLAQRLAATQRTNGRDNTTPAADKATPNSANTQQNQAKNAATRQTTVQNTREKAKDDQSADELTEFTQDRASDLAEQTLTIGSETASMQRDSAPSQRDLASSQRDLDSPAQTLFPDKPTDSTQSTVVASLDSRSDVPSIESGNTTKASDTARSAIGKQAAAPGQTLPVVDQVSPQSATSVIDPSASSALAANQNIAQGELETDPANPSITLDSGATDEAVPLLTEFDPARASSASNAAPALSNRSNAAVDVELNTADVAATTAEGDAMVEGESNSLAETAKLESLTQKSSLQDVDLLQQTQRLANDPSKASSLQSSFASNGVLDAVGLGAGAETALARTERAEPLQLSVTRPLNDPNWSERIFERINWMANAKQQHAEIRLDPPDLGPLKIEVQIRGEQTSVIMGSHSPQVRELLEQQIPKLREMLAESGFTQLDAQTQDQSQQRQAEHVSTQSRVLQFDESEQERQDEPIAQPIIQKHGKGSVDCYI